MESSRSRRGWCLAGVVVAAALVLEACGGVAPVKDPFNRAVAHASVGNHDAAIAGYREALEVDDEDTFAAFNLGAALEAKAEALRESAGISARVLRSQGNPGEADAAVAAAEERAVALVGEAEEIYQGLESRAGVPRAVSLRAGVNHAAIRFERGGKEEARAALRALIAAHEGSPLPRVALAAGFLRERDFASARPLLVEALAIDDTHREANSLMGDLLLSLGEVDAAKSHYEMVLVRDSDDLAAHLSLGRLAFGAGSWVEARSHYQRVLYVRPRNFEAHFRLAEICEQQKDWTEAAWHYLEAERVDDGRHPEIGKIDYVGRMEALWKASRSSTP